MSEESEQLFSLGDSGPFHLAGLDLERLAEEIDRHVPDFAWPGLKGVSESTSLQVISHTHKTETTPDVLRKECANAVQ